MRTKLVEAVKARFNALQDLLDGNPVHLGEKRDVLNEWFKICELPFVDQAHTIYSVELGQELRKSQRNHGDRTVLRFA